MKSKTMKNQTLILDGKRRKEERKRVLKVTSSHNPQEIIDIKEKEERDMEIAEETWEIRIEEGKDTEVSEENPTVEADREESEERDILEEGNIEEIDNPIMINKIYKKYLGKPKDPELEKSMMNTEILLINSLKINIGKLQEITESN